MNGHLTPERIRPNLQSLLCASIIHLGIFLMSSNTSLSTDLLAGSVMGGRDPWFYIVIVAGVILSTVTIIGNLMVMISFKIDRNLQTITNYFLLSLAVADTFIGIISIPLMTYYTALGSWDIGYSWCQFWLVMDYLMSNSSVMNLVLISLDRYYSVTRPLTYRPRRTHRKAIIMISLTYIVSALLWPPWIIGWPYIDGSVTVPNGACYIQFMETNPYLTVITAMCAFYIPVAVMIYLYVRVWLVAHKRRKVFGSLHGQVSAVKSVASVVQRKTAMSETLDREKQAQSRLDKVEKAIKKSEQKTARTLLAIMLAFIITWLPYDIVVIWEVFYPKTTPGWVWSAAYALCYVNSTLNPICYALGNPRYRQTYLRIFSCSWRRTSNPSFKRRSTIEDKI